MLKKNTLSRVRFIPWKTVLKLFGKIESNVESLTLDWASIVASSLHEKFKFDEGSWNEKFRDLRCSPHPALRKSVYGNISAKHVCKTWVNSGSNTFWIVLHSCIFVCIYQYVQYFYIRIYVYKYIQVYVRLFWPRWSILSSKTVSTHVVMASWSSWRRRLADHPRQLRFARESKHGNKHRSAIP